MFQLVPFPPVAGICVAIGAPSVGGVASAWVGVGVTVSMLVRTDPTSVSIVVVELSIMVVDDPGAEAVSEPTVDEVDVSEIVTTESVLLDAEAPQTARQEPMVEESLK